MDFDATKYHKMKSLEWMTFQRALLSRRKLPKTTYVYEHHEANEYLSPRFSLKRSKFSHNIQLMFVQHWSSCLCVKRQWRGISGEWAAVLWDRIGGCLPNKQSYCLHIFIIVAPPTAVSVADWFCNRFFSFSANTRSLWDNFCTT